MPGTACSFPAASRCTPATPSIAASCWMISAASRAPSAAVWSAGHPVQPAVHVVGHLHPGHLVPHEVQRPPGLHRADAGQDVAPLMQPEVTDLRHPPAEGARVEDELGLHELRAGRDLLAEPFGAEPGRRRERVLDRAEKTVGRGVHGAPGQQDMVLTHGAQRPKQLDAVQVEYRLGRRVVAELRVVAGHHQNVADAERRRPEQVGLQRDAVAVPAGHLHDRLEPGGHRGQAARPAGQPHVRALVVGDVDGIDPIPQQRGLLVDRAGTRPAGRTDLRGDREAARGQPLLQAHEPPRTRRR